MGIRDVLGAMRRFWSLATFALVLLVVLGLVAAYLPEQRYRATATLIVVPAGRVDFSSVDAVQFLLPSIAEQAGTETFATNVRKRVGDKVRVGGTRIHTEAEAGTSILKMQVEDADPAVAAIVANAAAHELVERKISNLVRIVVLDPARAPRAPFSPNRTLILFAASVIGLIAAVLSAVGANAVFPRTRVRGAADVRRHLGLEVIGEIPHTRKFPGQASRLFDPTAGYAGLVEAYQRLRANFDIVADGCSAVAVASCIAGEGKSSVAANLAWAAASMGENVVAVDADLRRPTLHEYFGILPEIGLADIPHGAHTEHLAQPTELPTLRVVPAGFPEQHPTAILHTAFPQVLDAFAGSRIIVDMPPLLGTADAVLVAAMTKAVILVADARHADPAHLGQALHELDRAGAAVLGVVLNHADPKRSPAFDYYYYSASGSARDLRSVVRSPYDPPSDELPKDVAR